jgi:hypothetical protein
MTGHLIHVGFAKAGSTFLQQWFADHPQLLYQPGGIAGFSNVFDISRQSAVPPPEFCCRVTSNEGLATPRGSYYEPATVPSPAAQARSAAILASLFPTAHVLLVTRGFRSVLLSGYSQYVRDGGYLDFGTSGPADPELGRHIWNYDHLVELYTMHFGERLMVMPYEMLCDDADGFVRTIERWLGIDHFPPPNRRFNPSLSPVELRWYPRLTRLLRRAPIGATARRALLRIYFPLLIDNRLRPLVRLLQFVRPAAPVTEAFVTDAMVDAFRGRAALLRDNPLYEPYKEDYLL